MNQHKVSFRSRRSLFVAALLTVVVGASPMMMADSAAQTWPAKPIKLLVGFPAGGASDVMARLVADRLGQALGQTIIVDNRPGAAGTLAAATAARSAPDGYTLLLASPTAITLAPSTMADRIQYNPAKDLVPVTQVARYPLFLIANPALGVKNVPDFLQMARRDPGKINFASFGLNTSGGLATEMVKLLAKVDVTHVPFNGSAPAIQALLGGHVDLMFDTAVTALPLIKSGKVVVLAISSAQRTGLAKDLPTFAEAVPGFEADSWVGLMAPAGTSPEFVARLQKEVAKFVIAPDVQDRFSTLGAEAVASTPQDFAQFLRDETARYARLVKEANLKIE
jgi:tripartite-type tricarboxylate transporter receptor subunit TctC